MSVLTLRLKPLFGAIVLGVILSLATGLVIKPEISIPEIRHYGYPLSWRETNLNGPTVYVLPNLAIDIAFWIIVSLIAFAILEIAFHKVSRTVDYKMLLFGLALLIPLGLVMDFIHESGHAIWGTAAGGRLTYMQVAYFEIYPQPAITPEFRLGYAQVEGLTTQFASGLMSLGGSLTTNIASWLIALILLTVSLGYKTQLALKILGLFGLLDLPLYVLFPQLGLSHWIFMGGRTPEPLLGARKVGIPDPVFYIIVILSTLGLLFTYFKPLREKLWKMTANIRGLEATFKTKTLLRHLFGAAVCGVLVSLATGAIENPPEASIIGARYYGYPFAWRVTMITMNNTTDFRFANLAADILFWVIIFFVASVVIRTTIAMFSRKTEDSPAI
ncbi:MAG: hypothetical protein OEZ29_05585 [Candidatus Bathyarchaeota archaeon]|nr:hypothetical protein [Candidatus Bathyarchaeota archaeon]MDH5780048.1 hypothetical protein [Candidatus Bathyarchaeota archaeon]